MERGETQDRWTLLSWLFFFPSRSQSSRKAALPLGKASPRCSASLGVAFPGPPSAFHHLPAALAASPIALFPLPSPVFGCGWALGRGLCCRVGPRAQPTLPPWWSSVFPIILNTNLWTERYHALHSPLPLVFSKRWTIHRHFTACVRSPGVTFFVLNELIACAGVSQAVA